MTTGADLRKVAREARLAALEEVAAVVQQELAGSEKMKKYHAGKPLEQSHAAMIVQCQRILAAIGRLKGK